MASSEISLDRGMPSSVDAERSILGAILLDNFAYTQAASSLKPDDFSLDSHRRVYQRMMDLQESGRAIDLITLTEELSRHKEVEAVGGVAYLSSLTEGLPHRANIEHYVKIVRDKALLRGVINAAQGAIAQAVEQSDLAEDVLAGLEGELFRLSENRGGNDFSSIKDIVKTSFGGNIDVLYERGQRITGLETHYTDFDEMTSGLQRSDLVILAARPSMGKTSLAMNMAENASVLDKKIVAMFSLEMSKESLLMRLMCSQAKVDAHKLRTGFLTRDDINKVTEAMGRLAEAPIFIDDTPGINVSEMRAKARRLKHQQGGLDLIIVDYLQLMSGTPMAGGRKYENRTQEVSAISRGLKMLAKDLDVPVVALSQLSRAPEARTGDHRPQLADLRESGSIEQDADLVMFIFREEVYTKDDPSLEGLAELIIAKQRNGPVGTVKLAFLKKSTRFENYAEEPAPEE